MAARMVCVVLRAVSNSLPQTLGDETLWVESRSTPQGVEYRRPKHMGGDLCFIVQPIGGSEGDVVAALWFKSNPEEDPVEAAYVSAMLLGAAMAGFITETHDVTADWTVPTCTGHPLWPASWRARLPGDGPEWVEDPAHLGDPAYMTPGSPATGDAILQVVLA